MRRLSRLVFLAVLAGAVGLGVVTATHDSRPAVSAEGLRYNHPLPEGHYWS